MDGTGRKKNGNYTGRVYKKSRRRPIRKVKIEMSLKGNILKASSATLVLLVCFARVCQRGNSAVVNGTFFFSRECVNASCSHTNMSLMTRSDDGVSIVVSTCHNDALLFLPSNEKCFFFLFKDARRCKD